MSARAVTGLLTRHAPALRAQGWQVDHDEGRNKDGVLKWTIHPPRAREPEKDEKPPPPDPPNPSPQVSDHKAGGLDGGSTQPAGYPITRQSVDNPPKPADTEPVTSTNGSAGQAGQKYPPSQALCSSGSHRGPVHPVSGHCDWCG